MAVVVPARRREDHAVVGRHDPVAAERREVDAVMERLAVDEASAPRRRPERLGEAPVRERPLVAGQDGDRRRGRVTGRRCRDGASASASIADSAGRSGAGAVRRRLGAPRRGGHENRARRWRPAERTVRCDRGADADDREHPDEDGREAAPATRSAAAPWGCSRTPAMCTTADHAVQTLPSVAGSEVFIVRSTGPLSRAGYGRS